MIYQRIAQISGMWVQRNKMNAASYISWKSKEKQTTKLKVGFKKLKKNKLEKTYK